MYKFKFVLVEEVIATALQSLSINFAKLCEAIHPIITSILYSAELVARMEGEKTAIHAEYEQERIAYQKLLKEYNMLEAVNDDLKEKVNMLRGGE